MIKHERSHTVRTLLRLQRQGLARQACISVATVRRPEAEDGGAAVAPGTLNTVQHAVKAAEAEFIPDGVRCRRSRTPEDKAALVRDHGDRR